MHTKKDIVLASNNQKKIKELSNILNQWHINVKPQAQFNIPEVPETGTTFVENAIIKARHAAQLSGLAAIADDSGIVVPALDGAPGVYSARYAGESTDDKANNNKLLQAMANIDQRNAYFVCVIAYMRHADDPLPIIAQGIWHGEILQQPQGDDGFGYDPLFWITEFEQTAAQLSPAHKNQISHRAMALQSFKQQYQQMISDASVSNKLNM